MSYAATAVRGLEACPFCKEMFPRGEQTECPICGVAVVPASKLPAPVTDDDGIPTSPEDEELPWTFFGRARGPLVLLAVLGLIAFAMPWVHQFTPDRRVYTGIEVARKLGFQWSVGVAWFTILPLVLTRRTIRKMRGARLAVAFFSFIPAIAAALLLLNPPSSVTARGLTFPIRYEWDPGIFATIVISVISTALAAARFGGSVEDIEVKTGSAANHTVH